MRCTTSFICLFLLATGYVATQQASGQETGIDLFEAIDHGDVIVQFIALNAKQANVLIRNESDRPLQLKMPKAIAAVPVLGQFGQNPNQNMNQNPAGGGGNQGVGGGFDMGNGQGFGNRQGAGMGIMRIAPGKVRKLKAKTVCLEHGKPDPKPRIAYRMIPLEMFTDDPIIIHVCEQLGNGQIPQKVAQAIAWHQGNDLSWQYLADLDRMKSIYRGKIKFFSSEELTTAKSLHASASVSNQPRYQHSSYPASASAPAGGFAWSISNIHGSSIYSTSRSGTQSTCR